MSTLCSVCGRAADPSTEGDPPPLWTADVVETSDGPQTRRVCPECTRRCVRSIEGKLDQSWW